MMNGTIRLAVLMVLLAGCGTQDVLCPIHHRRMEMCSPSPAQVKFWENDQHYKTGTWYFCRTGDARGYHNVFVEDFYGETERERTGEKP